MQDLSKNEAKTDKKHIICKKSFKVVHSDNETEYFLSFITKASKKRVRP